MENRAHIQNIVKARATEIVTHYNGCSQMMGNDATGKNEQLCCIYLARLEELKELINELYGIKLEIVHRQTDTDVKLIGYKLYDTVPQPVYIVEKLQFDMLGSLSFKQYPESADTDIKKVAERLMQLSKNDKGTYHIVVHGYKQCEGVIAEG